MNDVAVTLCRPPVSSCEVALRKTHSYAATTLTTAADIMNFLGDDNGVLASIIESSDSLLVLQERTDITPNSTSITHA